MPQNTKATVTALLIQRQAIINALDPLKAQLSALDAELTNEMSGGDYAVTSTGYSVECVERTDWDIPSAPAAELDKRQLLPFVKFSKNKLDKELKSGLIPQPIYDCLLENATQKTTKKLTFK